MEIIRLSVSESYSFTRRPCVLALGSFDGVHLGHRRVIETAKELAKRNNLPLSVLTFHPHPREVLGKGKIEVNYLMPLELRENAMASLGVDRLYVVKFDMAFASLSPSQFVERYLLRLDVRHVVVGYDFTYGAKGKGDVGTIESDGKGLFSLHVVPRMDHHGQKISSTNIRELLRLGEVERISDYLGNSYMTRGQIKTIEIDPKLGAKVSIWLNRYYTLPVEGTYEVNIFINHLKLKGVATVALGSYGSREINLLWDDVSVLPNRYSYIDFSWIGRVSYSEKIAWKR